MNHITIGTVELGTVPRVVAIIDRCMPINTVKGLQDKGASILEIRVDCFKEPFDEILNYIKEIKSTIGIPVIGTIRETESNRENRLPLFEQIIPLIDAVDIEIDTDINRAVISLAEGKTVIVSEHDYEKMPHIEGLEYIVDTAKSLGADIIKIAATAHSSEDVTRLLTFTESRSENIVSIAMGEAGTISRVAAPLFGSLFTYAFISNAVAPGQLSLEDMVKELKRFYPDF